jgi:translocation and assembly module TamB
MFIGTAVGVLLLVAGLAALPSVLARPDTISWIVDQLAAKTGSVVRLERVAPVVARTLTIGRVHARGNGWRVEIDDLQVRWGSPWQMLLERRVDLDRVAARRLRVVSASDPSSDLALPAALGLPMPVALARVELDELLVGDGDGAVQVTALAGRWSFDGATQRADVERLQLGGFELAAQGTIAAASPFALQFEARARKDAAATIPAAIVAPISASDEAVLMISGNLEHMSLHSRIALGAARAEGTARVHPFAMPFVEQLHLRATGIDPHAFFARVPSARIDLSLQGDLRSDQRFVGRLSARNALVGPLDRSRVPVVRLDADIEAGRDDARVQVRTLDLGAAGGLAGQLVWRAGKIESEIQARAIDLSGLWSTLYPSRLAGRLRLATDGVGLDARGELTDREMRVRFDLASTAERLHLRSFRFEARGALAEGMANLELRNARRFDGTAHVERLDPSRLGRFPAASLSGDVVVHGALAGAEGPHGRGSLQLRDSQFRGLALAGDSRVEWQAHHRLSTTTSLVLGDMRLEAQGALGESGDRLQVRLESPSLAPIGFGLAGSVSLTGTLGGTLTEPDIDLALRGQGLSVRGETRMASVRARLRLLRDDLDIDAALQGLAVAGVQIAEAHARVDGMTGDHRVRLDGRVHGIDLALALRGALEGVPAAGWVAVMRAATQPAHLRWHGTLIELAERAGSGVTLLEPAALDVAVGALHLARSRLDAAGGQVVIDEIDIERDRLRSSGRFSGLEARRLLAAAGFAVDRGAREAPEGRLTVDGDLRLAGDWQWRADASGAAAGAVELHRESGDLVVQRVALGLERLRASLALNAGELSARVDLGSRLGWVDALAAVPIEAGRGYMALRADAPVKGQARFALDGTAFATLMRAEGIQLQGKAEGDVAWRGSIASPTLFGQVRGRDLLIQVPGEGVSLRRGRFDLQFDEREARLAGARFEGDSGHLEAAGRLSWAQGRLDGSLGADAVGLSLLNGSELRLVATGRLDLDVRDGLVSVRARVRADEGDLSLRAARATVSPDVVVRGKSPSSARSAGGGTSALPVLSLALDLGDHFQVRGFGAKARLTGTAQLAKAEAGPLRLLGRVGIVEGTVNAYGQLLRIDQGSVTFNGPVDNPVLDITALRPNIPIKAGVQVTGFARAPRLRLFSDPSLPESQVLAWVVMGRSAEGLALADWQFMAEMAAASLTGASEAAPLSTRIARAAGLDELGVRSSAGSSLVPGAGSGAATSAAETVVAVGKRLSDKLTVTVERSLTGVGTVLRARYQLTPRWLVQAETGVRQTVDLFFSIAFNRWFDRASVTPVPSASPSRAPVVATSEGG